MAFGPGEGGLRFVEVLKENLTEIQHVELQMCIAVML